MSYFCNSEQNNLITQWCHYTVVLTQWHSGQLQWLSQSGRHTVVGTQWLAHSGWHTVVGWYTVVTQRSSHSGHNTKVEWSSHGVHHKVRQLVRKMSNFHKSLRFVIYCAAYGAERLFSLVFLSLLKILLQNHFM